MNIHLTMDDNTAGVIVCSVLIISFFLFFYLVDRNDNKSSTLK